MGAERITVVVLDRVCRIDVDRKHNRDRGRPLASITHAGEPGKVVAAQLRVRAIREATDDHCRDERHDTRRAPRPAHLTLRTAASAHGFPDHVEVEPLCRGRTDTDYAETATKLGRVLANVTDVIDSRPSW